MAQAKLKTDQIYDKIMALGNGGISEFEFIKYKKDIDHIRKHDELAGINLMAMLYSFNTDYDKAIELHELSLQYSPESATFSFNYGVTLANDGKVIRSIEQFVNAAKLSTQKNYKLSACIKAIEACLVVFDVATIKGLLIEYAEAFTEDVDMLMPLNERLNLFTDTINRAGVSEDAVERFSTAIIGFFKQYNLEPHMAHFLQDPDGGLFVGFDIKAPVEEVSDISDQYIDYVIDNDLRNAEVSAFFNSAV